MRQLLPALTLLAALAFPVAAHAQLSGYGGGGHGGGCQSGGCGGGGGHGGGGYGGGGHGGGCDTGGCGGGGGHGGGGSVNIDINVSGRASAASDAYASAYARSYAYAAQSDVYGGSQSQSIAYGSAFAGGGYSAGNGCASACGVIPVGTTYAPYGPGGPYVTYTVIQSRVVSRESYYQDTSYGRGHESGYSRDCRQTCDASSRRGEYVRGYHDGYQTGFSDYGYSQDCTSCEITPAPAQQPPYQPEADPYYFPSLPEQGCYRGGSGECG